MRGAIAALALAGCGHIPQPERQRIVGSVVVGTANEAMTEPFFDEVNSGREQARLGGRLGFEYRDDEGGFTSFKGAWLARPGLLDKERGTVGAVTATFGQLGPATGLEAGLTLLTSDASTPIPMVNLIVGNTYIARLGICLGPHDPLFTFNLAQMYLQLEGAHWSTRFGFGGQGQLALQESGDWLVPDPHLQFVGRVRWAFETHGVEIDTSLGGFSMVALGAFYDFE